MSDFETAQPGFRTSFTRTPTGLRLEQRVPYVVTRPLRLWLDPEACRTPLGLPDWSGCGPSLGALLKGWWCWRWQSVARCRSCSAQGVGASLSLPIQACLEGNLAFLFMEFGLYWREPFEPALGKLMGSVWIVEVAEFQAVDRTVGRDLARTARAGLALALVWAVEDEGTGLGDAGGLERTDFWLDHH